MKLKFLSMTLIIPAVILFAAGCSNDSAGSTTDPFGGGGGGGGGTGNVQVTVSAVQGQDGPYFQFTPGVAIWMTQITANCAAAGVNNETVPVNLSSGPNDPISVGPVTVMQIGQQWSFTITGNVGNQQGQAFTTNVNFTVQ